MTDEAESTGRVLVLRHLLFEDLGLFAATFADVGLEVAYCDVGVQPVDAAAVVAADAVVVLGGPIGVADVDRYPYLADELAAIRERVEQDRPTLGVCLGAQLIAVALGGAVRPTGRVEIGYGPLTLAADPLGALAPVGATPVLHWHGDAFTVPAGATGLASTPGYPNQAFSVGRTLALQFHLEVDAARIEQWLIGHTHELTANGVDVQRIRQQAAEHGAELSRASDEVLRAWLTRTGVLAPVERDR